MKRLEKDKQLNHVRLTMKFKDDYPFTPPFVRIVYPRFKRQTGYIIDGAFCMELLTNQVCWPFFVGCSMFVVVVPGGGGGGSRCFVVLLLLVITFLLVVGQHLLVAWPPSVWSVLMALWCSRPPCHITPIVAF